MEVGGENRKLGNASAIAFSDSEESIGFECRVSLVFIRMLCAVHLRKPNAQAAFRRIACPGYSAAARLSRSGCGINYVMSKLVALIASLAFCSAAHACSCARMTGSTQFADAELVLRGRVVATSLVKNPGLGAELGREVVRAEVTPIEIFKGKLSTRYVVIGGSDYGNPVCTRALISGVEYVFTLGAEMVASSCNSWLSDDPEIKESLKTFRRLKAQQK